MNIDLSLVTITPADSTCNEFLFQARKEAFWWIIERVWRTWDEALHRSFFEEDYLNCEPMLILYDNVAIGSYCCTRDKDCYQFENFFVLPKYQNQGIGSLVLQKALEMTDEEGVPVRLVYWNFNPAARLYTRMGFKEIGQHNFPDTKDYWVISERKPVKCDESE